MNFAIYFYPSEFRKPDLRVNTQGRRQTCRVEERGADGGGRECANTWREREKGSLWWGSRSNGLAPLPLTSVARAGTRVLAGMGGGGQVVIVIAHPAAWCADFISASSDALPLLAVLKTCVNFNSFSIICPVALEHLVGFWRATIWDLITVITLRFLGNITTLQNERSLDGCLLK